MLSRSPSPSILEHLSPSRIVHDHPMPAENQEFSDLLHFSSSSDEDSDIDEIDWKKQNWEQNVDIVDFNSVSLCSSRSLPNRTRPITYFELFFDKTFMNNIVEQTNRYATEKNARYWQDMTVPELKAFFGMIIQMAIHKLPTIEEYWSSDSLLQVVEIAETMTLQRFQKILKFLHINDNLGMPRRTDANFDKLCKVRPLVDRLNILCRSTLKQYMPMKPIKRQFKVWCRADSTTGYLYQYDISTKKLILQTGLGEKVVKFLCEPLITNGYSGYIAFDNFFSSIDFLQNLYENDIYSTATIRNERVGLPLLVKKPKNTGDIDEDKKLSEVVKRESTKVKKLKKGKWKWRVKGNVGFAV